MNYLMWEHDKIINSIISTKNQTNTKSKQGYNRKNNKFSLHFLFIQI